MRVGVMLVVGARERGRESVYVCMSEREGVK